MQTENKKYQSALIWSNKKEAVDFLASSNLKNKYTLEILNENIYKQLGNVKNINSMQSFPLSAHINEKFYEDISPMIDLYLLSSKHKKNTSKGDIKVENRSFILNKFSDIMNNL